MWAFVHFSSAPGGILEDIERYLEIAAPIALGFRQPPAGDIDLQCRENQLRHRQGYIARGPQLRKARLVLSANMGVLPFLLAHGALPSGRTAAGLIVMPGKEPRLIRQSENPLEAAPQRTRIATRKIGARGPAIGHEQRIMNEGRITDDLSDRSERVTRREQHVSLKFAQSEALALREEMIPLGAVRRKAFWKIVEILPEALNFDDMVANCGRSAGDLF